MSCNMAENTEKKKRRELGCCVCRPFHIIRHHSKPICMYDMSNIELVIQHVSCAPGWGLRSKKGRPRKGSESSKAAPVLTAEVRVCVCVCALRFYIHRYSMPSSPSACPRHPKHALVTLSMPSSPSACLVTLSMPSSPSSCPRHPNQFLITLINSFYSKVLETRVFSRHEHVYVSTLCVCVSSQRYIQRVFSLHGWTWRVSSTRSVSPCKGAVLLVQVCFFQKENNM
jgi:hypothetical protein